MTLGDFNNSSHRPQDLTIDFSNFGRPKHGTRTVPHRSTPSRDYTGYGSKASVAVAKQTQKRLNGEHTANKKAVNGGKTYVDPFSRHTTTGVVQVGGYWRNIGKLARASTGNPALIRHFIGKLRAEKAGR